MSIKPGEPTSPNESQILVFTPGNTPKQKIAATLAQQQLLAGLSSKEEPKNKFEQTGSGNFLKNVVGKINKFVGESIEWSHYRSGKAAEIIENNLNSETPNQELLAMVNSYGQNLIALILAQARLPDWANVEILEIYRPYFQITEITGEIAQRIKEIIKNAIRNHLNANQQVDGGLIKTITNEIINQLKKLAIDSSDENVEPVLQIQQLLEDSDLISNLEQLVQEILSDLRETDPQEAQEPEQINLKLDTRINQLQIVLATQPSSQASEQGLLQRLFSLPNRNFGLPIPTSWWVSPIFGVIIGNLLTREPGFNWISGAISAGIGGLVGAREGWQHARRILEMAAEAQAAKNPERPLTNQPRFYEMISTKYLFERIQNALENTSSAQPESIRELLLQIHLIRILWNEYQYPILENNLESNDLEKIEKLAEQYGITLESKEIPLVSYRNLLLLVEVLGIKLIQKTQQARQSESDLSPNPETFWHQTGLNRLREAVIEKVEEIDQALGFKNHPRFYLLEAFKKAIIPALFGFLFYGISTETWRKLNL